MTGAPPNSSVDGAEVDPLIGRRLADKFLIEEMLGAGAMGAVYKARQIALDRAVAIKVMHRQLASDAAYAARFDREAKAASRLDHPNLIRILDYGKEPDGLFYIAMEFLDGRDLFQVMEQDWPLSPARIVDVLSQTLAGLAAAHEVGIIHRDLKPENIMLLRRKADDGKSFDLIKVCDFGIAKIVETRVSERPPGAEKSARKLSTAGFVVGTPEFMSPEQAHGEELDARSDLYSVGVILFQLLTGQLPFEAETPLGVVLKLLHDDTPRPSAILKTVHPGLEEICMKAMSKQRANRFADARDMRSAMRALATDADARISGGSLPSAIASAPTLELVALPASRGTASLSAIAVQSPTKPRGRTRWVIGAIAAISLISMPIALWKHQRGDAHATVAITTSPIVTGAASAASGAVSDPITPTVIAPIADSLTDPTPIAHNGKHRGRHDAQHPNVSTPTAPASAESPAPTSLQTAPPAQTIQPSPPPTPPPTSSAPPVTVAPTPPVAVVAPFDPSGAHVDLETPNSVGTTPSSVLRALSPIDARISACYRAALTPANANATTATLHLQADEDGFITDAHVTGAPAAVASCIEALARGRKIPDVDTGNASADVPLAMRPR